MPFIGKPPAVGAYSVLDALTASATANYSLQLNGAAFVPNSVNQLLVSLNGVIQKPGSSFVVSGSTLTFKNGGSDFALTSSDSIDFIISMGGDPLNVGVVSDGTISNSKITGMASSKLSGALPAIDGSALTGSVGNYVLLSTQNEPSSAAQITLTLDSTGTYAEQIFVLAGWYQVNLVDTYLRTVEGGSVITGSSDYQYKTSGFNVATGNNGEFGDNDVEYIRTNWYSTGDSANETNDLIIHVRNAESSTQRTMITGSHYGLAGNANMSNNLFIGRRASAVVATAIQVTSSNAASSYVFSNGGYIKHYGVK